MSKLKLYFLSLTIWLFAGAFLTHCSDSSTGSGSSGLAGTWELTKLTMETAFVKLEYNPSEIGLSITLKINEDGTFSITEIEEGETTTSSGTWTTDGNKLIVVEGGQTLEFNYSLSRNKLIMSFEEDDDGITVSVTQEFTRQ